MTLPGEPSLTSSTSSSIEAAAFATADGRRRRGERAFVGRGNRIYPGWDRISRSRWLKREGESEAGKGGCNITHSLLHPPNFIIAPSLSHFLPCKILHFVVCLILYLSPSAPAAVGPDLICLLHSLRCIYGRHWSDCENRPI